MTNHLEDAARLAGRKNNFSYYCYHARVAIRASVELIYIGIMSFIHAFLPFIYSGFGLAEMLVKTINKIRVSIPDWEGWKELDKEKKMAESICGLQRDREGHCYNEDCMCDPCECTEENMCDCCD
jgi:hypothetical protein